jgi:hypothetical protein
MLTVFRKLVKGGGIDDMSGGGRRRLKAPTSPFLSLLGSSFTSPLLTSFVACHTLPLPSFDFCSQHSLLPLFTPELVIACHGPWPHSFIIFAQKKKAICITCCCRAVRPGAGTGSRHSCLFASRTWNEKGCHGFLFKFCYRVYN